MKITENFFQLGVPEFPMYLSKGERLMLIEGGTGATVDVVVKQIHELGISPDKIESILLTHSHPDHIGGYPRLRKMWPHIKIVASSKAKELLGNEKLLDQFLYVEKAIAKIMMQKGQLDQIPVPLDEYDFSVDEIVEDGDTIDLGSDVCWTVHSLPGHSPCQIGLSEQKDGNLIIGDSTGFYSPAKGLMWPNYFVSLEAYCKSIKKLMSIPAKRVALSHNGVIEDAASYLKNALKTTEKWHLEMIERTAKGEKPEEIAEQKAEWVDTFANILPIQIQKDMCSLMIKRSRDAADIPGLFD